MNINYEIPEDVHRKAKAAAALKGQTLKDWLIEAIDMFAMADLWKADHPNKKATT